MTIEELGKLIQRSVKRWGSVEVEGLGVFSLDRQGNISFRDAKRPRIFIAYATEDRASAERLFKQLTARGFSVWLDRHNLLPGQDWPQRIEDAIASSDFVIACFSRKSVGKRGGFQSEIRHALEYAANFPLDDVFLIPVRLNNCRIPARIQREMQYVDMFPSWKHGFESVLRIVASQIRAAA